jgi:hypothetical protein
VLVELVREVQRRHQELREKIAAAEKFRERARELWVRYEPRPKPRRFIGVDSGWNYRAFQGYFLYAVDAAALFEDGRRALEPMYEVDVGTLTVREGNRVGPRPKLYLMSKGMQFEYELALEGYEKADYVLVDGSLLARYYDPTTFKTTRLIDYFTDLMGKDRLVFVSKASYSTRLLRGELGDSAYFNLLVPWAGHTRPESVGSVTFFYARFADYTAALRIEVPVKDLSEQEVRELVDVLASDQANGYPNVLRLVDSEVRVSAEQLKMVARLLGLEAEAGARDVLG